MRDMELSLPLVVEDEVDSFVEGVVRERFKGRGKDYSAKRRTSPESVFFDRFNSLSQLKFFEFATFEEGVLADDFDRTWDDDGLERIAPTEGVFFDLFDPSS